MITGRQEIIRSALVHVHTLWFTPTISLRRPSSDPNFLSVPSLVFVLFMSPSLAPVFSTCTGCILLQQWQQGHTATFFLPLGVTVPDLPIFSHRHTVGNLWLSSWWIHVLHWAAGAPWIRQFIHILGRVSPSRWAPPPSCCLSPTHPKALPPISWEQLVLTVRFIQASEWCHWSFSDKRSLCL